MICEKCHQEYDGGMAACPYCGNATPQPQQPQQPQYEQQGQGGQPQYEQPQQPQQPQYEQQYQQQQQYQQHSSISRRSISRNTSSRGWRGACLSPLWCAVSWDWFFVGYRFSVLWSMHWRSFSIFFREKKRRTGWQRQALYAGSLVS